MPYKDPNKQKEAMRRIHAKRREIDRIRAKQFRQRKKDEFERLKFENNELKKTINLMRVQFHYMDDYLIDVKP